MLAKAPGFTAVAILTLALGIGANTAIFSVVNAVVLKPLPLRQPDRLVALWETEAAEGTFPLADQDFVDWRVQNRTFDGMAAFTWPEPVNVSGAGSPEQALLVETQANFFDVAGAAPQLGRTFAAGEDTKGGNHVVILSNAFWKSHFGGSKDALGKPLLINSETYTVVGVMPAAFLTPGTADIWTPLDLSPAELRGRGSHYLRAIGRMKAGVTLEQARAELKTISENLAKQFRKPNENVFAVVNPLRTDLARQAATPLWILFGAVALVLLIACANVANLLLARSVGRRREMALRGAVGASRGRLVRQLLTESLMLSIAGGAAGALLAYNLVAVLATLKPQQYSRPNLIRVDLPVLIFCIAVSVAVGLLFGLAPAFETSRVNLIEALKSRSIGGTAGGGRELVLRDILVAGEIALRSRCWPARACSCARSSTCALSIWACAPIAC
jgi:putative ABC transport system permease protein